MSAARRHVLVHLRLAKKRVSAAGRRLGDHMRWREESLVPTRGVLHERDFDLLSAGPAPTLAGGRRRIGVARRAASVVEGRWHSRVLRRLRPPNKLSQRDVAAGGASRLTATHSEAGPPFPPIVLGEPARVRPATRVRSDPALPYIGKARRAVTGFDLRRAGAALRAASPRWRPYASCSLSTSKVVSSGGPGRPASPTS